MYFYTYWTNNFRDSNMKRVTFFIRARCKCPVRARFLKNLCVPLATLLLLALSLTLLIDWRPRNSESPEPDEEEVEEWTTDDDGKQVWTQDQMARQDRAIVYLANRANLKELALSVELLFRVFNDRFRYRFNLIAIFLYLSYNIKSKYIYFSTL